MGFEAWQQYRAIRTPAFDVVAQGDDDDVHMDISVSHDEDGGLEAECTIYNLARSNWRELDEADSFQIELGYRGEITLPVISGEIEEKKPAEDDGADTAYTFVGPDESEKRISHTWETKTWEEPTVDFLARELADLAQLRPGRVEAPGEIVGDSWSISRSSSLEYAFDRLAEEAEDIDEEKYEWYASRGKVHFLPKSESGDAEINELTDGEQGNVLHAEETEGKEKKSDGGSNLEIEALLDPQIEKDALVPITTDEHRGIYRVANYSLESSTGDGRHEMEAELVPTDGEYRFEDDPRAGVARRGHI
jgi:hypothetical protein